MLFRSNSFTVTVKSGKHNGFVVSNPESVAVENAIGIYTEEQLQEIIDEPTRSYILANNIDLSSSFRAIGVVTKYFSGTFNGNGKIINFGDHSIEIIQENPLGTTSYIGLFSNIEGGEVKNLILKGKIQADISTGIAENNSVNIGAVAGENNNGIIKNVASSVELSITTKGKIYTKLGGIAGYNRSTSAAKGIINCYSTGNVSITSTEQLAIVSAGGLVGENPGNISYSFSSNNVTNVATEQVYTIQQNAGGISGSAVSSAKIENCAVVDSVISTNSTSASMGRITSGTYGTYTDNYVSSAVKMYDADGLKNPPPSNANNNNGAVFTDTTQAGWNGSGTPNWTINFPGTANEASPWVWGDNQPALWFED